jgi:hypothetical protein
VAAALADMFAAADPLVSAFALPPETFNPPALVCTDPAVVTKRTAGMGVDQCEFVVIAAVGLAQADDLDGLCDLADKAILADPTLQGVARAAMVTEARNFRPLKVGGTDYRAADLAIRIDM